MQEVFENIIERLERLKTPCELGMIKNGRYVLRDNEIVLRDNAIEIVKQTAAEYNNGWIPCDGVHFPEENVYVRVTTWTETEKIGFRRDGKWFVYGSDGMAEATVLAWQPTQPYQPKGEREAC